MKRIPYLILIIFCVCIQGCSIPSVSAYSQIYSFTKKEEKIKVALGGKKKNVIIRDFRINDAYEEDIAALKEKVEKYISSHPELSDTIKNSLRELKVAGGLTREQVELLLNKPDKLIYKGASSGCSAQELWVYRINKVKAFTVFIIPVFFVREGYYLYFTGDTLTAIERHYLKQIVKESPGSGIIENKDKAEEKS